MTGAQIVEQARSALSTDYTGRDIEKVGLNKGAAMMLKVAEMAQDGDLDAVNLLLDRLIGRPVQQVNSLSVAATLPEFLDELNRREGIVPNPIDPGAREAVDPFSY